jgi:outer membrane protein OmpA-like peptidoglycan-associated protein
MGNSVVWEEINFNTGEATLQKNSTPSLKTLAKFLQENPDFRVEISGHTDNQGDEENNQSLSQERAKTVVKYLIEEGFISPKRLEAKGYGSSQPLNANDTEENRKKNRRVEVKIIE